MDHTRHGPRRDRAPRRPSPAAAWALSRRGFIRLGAAGLLAGAAATTLPPRLGRAGGGGMPFAEPPVRASRAGLLDTTLTARLGPVRIGDRVATSTAYDGAFTGPTLRVRAGDRLRVAVDNRLSELTNLHTHGLHVSPSGNSDNIFVRIDPGQRFQYEYDLPAGHPAGLYWYHPHGNGVSDAQVFGGMAGALIIEGDLDALPGVAGLPERLLVLQATHVDAQGQVQVGDEAPDFPLLKTVNGLLNPTLSIRPGETQRWRIGNLSADTYFLIQLAGHVLHVVNVDGNTLDAVTAEDQFLLPPGKRVEALVQGGAPGTYPLRTLPYNKGAVSMGAGPIEPESVLATLVSEGAPVAPRPLPTTLLPFVDLRGVPIAQRREITFDVPPPSSMASMASMGGMDAMQAIFEINGKQFDANRVDTTVRLGTTEEWVIRNTSDQVHPFHIHVNPFQVVAVNDQPVTAHGYEDTVNLPRLGSVTMRTRFLDFPGKFVYHCHILMHEDNGMMAVIEVQP